jgi:hypothetical protein
MIVTLILMIIWLPLLMLGIDPSLSFHPQYKAKWGYYVGEASQAELYTYEYCNNYTYYLQNNITMLNETYIDVDENVTHHLRNYNYNKDVDSIIVPLEFTVENDAHSDAKTSNGPKKYKRRSSTNRNNDNKNYPKTESVVAYGEDSTCRIMDEEKYKGTDLQGHTCKHVRVYVYKTMPGYCFTKYRGFGFFWAGLGVAAIGIIIDVIREDDLRRATIQGSQINPMNSECKSPC